MVEILTSINFVRQVADALDAVSEAVGDAAKRGYKGYKFVARQRERQRYVHMLHNFTKMRRTQSAVIGSLRYYLTAPDKADWSYMAQTLEALVPVVDELLETMSGEEGEIVLHQRQAFADLCSALQGRKEVLGWLSTLKPPFSDEQIRHLKKLADEYERLIQASDRAAATIEEYAKSLNGA